MNNLQEEKYLFSNKLKNLDLYAINSLLNEAQYSLNDMLDYFNYSDINNLNELINNTSKENNISKENEKVIIFQNLIKECFLDILKQDSNFLKNMIVHPIGLDVINYIIMDNKTNNEDLIFIFNNKLLDEDALFNFLKTKSSYLTENMNHKKTYFECEQLLKIEDLLKEKKLTILKKNMVDLISESYFLGLFNWDEFINSNINQFLKIEKNGYQNFLIENDKNFYNSFSFLEFKELKNILKTVPELLSDGKLWLIERLTEDYRNGEIEHIINLDCLNLVLEKTPLKNLDKFHLLQDLIDVIDKNTSLTDILYRKDAQDNKKRIEELKNYLINMEKNIIKFNLNISENKIKKRI